MKLVQKSLMHKGYIVLKNGKLIPLWGTEDTLAIEADKFLYGDNKSVIRTDVEGIYATNEDILYLILEKIKTYKEKYGIIPQGLTEELRTGFSVNPPKVPYYYK